MDEPARFDAWLRRVDVLRLSQGILADRFGLHVIIGAPFQVRRLIALLVYRLGLRRPGAAVVEEFQDWPMPEATILSWLRAPQRDMSVVFASGAAPKDEAWTSVWRRLNGSRDHLVRQHPRPLLICLPEGGFAWFAENAPDLWSIRGTSLDLAAPLTARDLGETLSLDAWGGKNMPTDRRGCLTELLDLMPRLVHALYGADEDIPESIRSELHGWSEGIARQLLPLLDQDQPLLIAITGAMNVGKSTLFNYLVGGERDLSPPGVDGGTTRRLLIALQSEAAVAPLSRRLGRTLEPLANDSPRAKDQICKSDPRPLYVVVDSLPRHVAIIDTPGFNGDKEDLEVTRSALRASDVWLYLVTNQTYKDAVQRQIIATCNQELVDRASVLLYWMGLRADDETVTTHLDNVADSIYGASRAEFVLGQFRIPQDYNQQQVMSAPYLLRSAEKTPLRQWLAARTREEIHARTIEQGMRKAHDKAAGLLQTLRTTHAGVNTYRLALQERRSNVVEQAQDNLLVWLLLQRMAIHYAALQPGWVRGFRQAAKYIAWPSKQLRSGVLRLYRWLTNESEIEKRTHQAIKTTEDRIIEKAAGLRADLLAASLPDPNDPVQVPSFVKSAQQNLHAKEWVNIQQEIKTELGGVILAFPEHPTTPAETEIDVRLRKSAEEARSKLTLADQAKEGALAVFAILPSLAAVVWIFATGDPKFGPGFLDWLAHFFQGSDALAGAAGLVGDDATTELNELFDRQALRQAIEDFKRLRKDQIGALLDRTLLIGFESECVTRLAEADRLLSQLDAILARGLR